MENKTNYALTLDAQGKGLPVAVLSLLLGIDASEITHAPVSQQPYIHSVYKDTDGSGQETEVLIPLNKSVAAYASANAQSPIGDSKAEAVQNAAGFDRESQR